MINGHTDQFLDIGWYSESTLFYNGYIYWHEAQTDNNETVFFVDRWRAQNEDDLYFHSLLNPDNTLSWERIIEIHDKNLDFIRKKYLESPIYDGKLFWEIENELVWLDEGTPVKT